MNQSNRIHILVAGVGFVVGVLAVATVLLVAWPHLVGAASPSPSPTPYVAPSASPSAGASTKAVGKAVSQALADALGMSPADLHKALKQGQTVQQIAGQKGISQATLQASFNQDLKTQLDKVVSAGTITPAQESKVLARYQSKIPHWDAPAKSPAPTPSPS